MKPSPYTSYSLRCPRCQDLVVQVLDRDVDGRIRERCVSCGYVRRVANGQHLRDLYEYERDRGVEDFATSAVKAGLVQPLVIPKRDVAPVYIQPARITKFHEGRQRANALLAARKRRS